MTINTITFNNESFSSSGTIEYFPDKDQFKYKFTIDSGLVSDLEKRVYQEFSLGKIKFVLASLNIDLCGAEFLAIGKLVNT
jgi:hypothetical protein